MQERSYKLNQFSFFLFLLTFASLNVNVNYFKPEIQAEKIAASLADHPLYPTELLKHIGLYRAFEVCEKKKNIIFHFYFAHTTLIYFNVTFFRSGLQQVCADMELLV